MGGILFPLVSFTQHHICPMLRLTILIPLLLFRIVPADSDCVDRSPYCNHNDCSVRPGYAREFCKKTCGNCTEICENSKFVACTEDRKKECDSMLRDYCPVLCGACRPKKRNPSSTTIRPNVTSLLNLEPPATLASIGVNKPGPRRSPIKVPPEMSNKLEVQPAEMPEMIETTTSMAIKGSPIEPYQLPPSAIFLPELPEPIRIPLWASYPPENIRRSPIRSSFFPLDNSPTPSPFSPDRRFQALITLLGCRDRDPGTCSKITEETCLSRPGFYLKLCPVRCRNCDGLQCFDSIKVDCEAVRHAGGCRLAAASEYCPRTCQMCPLPPSLADSVSVCRDELDTCISLAEGGLCESADVELLRLYCARSCGFCKQPQYYMHSPFSKNKHRSS